MPRKYAWLKPHKSKYERKTTFKHGRRVVKPIEYEDFEEMIRICTINRDKYKEDSANYFKWYRNYIILIIGVNIGSRINTILELTPYAVAGGKVTITEHKTGKSVQYDMNEEVYDEIKKYIKKYNFSQNEYIFPKDRNTKDAIGRTTAWRWIKKLAQEAGVDYHVGTHSLRKSFGRWIWDETHDLLLVQELLQHSSSEETQRYICLEKNDIEKFRSEIKHLPEYK